MLSLGLDLVGSWPAAPAGPATVPGQSAAPSLVGGAEQATVTLAADPANGGSPITARRWQVTTAADTGFAAPVASGTTSPAVISPLAAGSYIARAQVDNVVGAGAWSPASAPATVTAGGLDADATAYIAAVETADGQALEAAVKTAINNLVVGLKADGIWAAMLTSCLLIGPRTVAGALVPLRGPAPTAFNLGSALYDRKTGLKGNTSGVYIDTNVQASAAGATNNHLAVSMSEVAAATGTVSHLGSARATAGSVLFSRGASPSANAARNQNNTGADLGLNPASTGFFGTARSVASEFVMRAEGANTTVVQAAITIATTDVFIFTSNGVDRFSNARFRWWSYGNFVALATLETRMAAYQTAIEAAIP